jgi:hypothetical protein
MAKRRSSLKGRGSEILFGEPQAVEIQPLASEPDRPQGESLEPRSADSDAAAERSAESEEQSPTPPPPEPPPEVEDASILAGLAEEAQDAETGPAPDKDRFPVETAPPPTPEMELAFYDEAVAAEEPPEPVAEAPIPTLEETMEEKQADEQVTLNQPPPPETADVSGDVLPPRPRRTFFALGDMNSIATSSDIQSSDGGRVKELELPDRNLTEEEKQKLLARLGADRFQQLDEEISKMYDQVVTRVGENQDLATECFNQLLKARDIVINQDVTKIPQAEYAVEQVRARLKRATESEAGAKKYAWWIASWGLFWFLIFIGVLIALNYTWFQQRIVPSVASNTPVDMVIFLPAMVWGGIGGVAAVFYSLFKHVGLRDFDTQYNLSYVGKPFLGVILGATVYMIIHLMIMTLGILPVGLAPSGETVSTPTVAPWIIYLLAWACGFKENRIFDLVDRVIKQIFSGRESAAPAELQPPTA